MKKNILMFFIFLFVIPSAFALGVNIPTGVAAGNYSGVYVNDSLCWLGHCTEASLLHSSLGNLAWSVAGHTIDANIDMNGYTFTNSDVLLNNTDGGYNISINSNLPITTTDTGTFGTDGEVGVQLTEGSWLQVGSNDAYPTTSGIAFGDWDGATPSDAYVNIFEYADDDLALEASDVKIGNFRDSGNYLLWDETELGIYKATNRTAFIDTDGQIETDYGLDFDTVGLPPKLTATLVAEAGNVDIGEHIYYVTYYTALGETSSDTSLPRATITATAGSGKVDLTNIPVSADYRVTGRRIYRTKADASYWKVYSLVDIANNVDTTYQDNTADAGLTGFENEGYFRIDTTNKIITIDGVASMIIAEGATSVGYNTGYAGSCTVVGAYAGTNMEPGATTNSLFGDYAGNDITSGTANSFFGQVSGARVTTGSYNHAFGRNSLASIAGSNNIAFGYGAGYGTTGAGNVFIGHRSGWADATVNAGKADYNTAVGYQTGFLLTSGDYNILFGHETGNNIITGSYNILIGNDVDASASDADYELNIGDIIKGNLTSGNVNIPANFNVSGNFTGNQIYGGMWYHNHEAIAIDFAVQYTNYTLWADNAGSLNGFSYTGGVELSSNLTAQVAGKYQVVYNAIGDGQNNHIYVVSVFVNNIGKDNCDSHKKLTAGGDILTMNGNCFIDLNVGDDVFLGVSDWTGTGTGNYYGMNLNLVRVGD